MNINNWIIRNIIRYPTHINLNYMWTFGSLLSFLFFIQIFSGIFLASYYIADTDYALQSILFIITEVQGGWVAYRCHVLGSSFIFFMLYMHIYRGIYYQLYHWKNRFSWWTGYLLFLLTMATAFFGYVLPWGQMSFWAATVIINMISIIPYIGEWLTIFLWGGNSVNTYTLRRFFILHLILPFLLLALITLHIIVIHSNNSTPNFMSRLNSSYRITKLPDTSFLDLYPLFIIKDIFTIIGCSFLSIIFILYYPEYFTNYINWVPANPQLTPSHIIPEWYFLPFYGIIKVIPHKIGGITTMVVVILSPLLLPFVTRSINSITKFGWFANVWISISNSLNK